MAHNSKRNRRHITAQDGDDYVYPTAKVRETKTRDRRSGKNLIQRGLADQENLDFDAFKQEGEDDDFYDPNFAAYEIEELIEMFGTDEENQDDDTNPYEKAFFEYGEDACEMDNF